MREVPLGTVLDALIDHRGKTPKKLGGDFTDAGVRVVSAIHIKNGRINWEERLRFVDHEMFRRWMPVPTRAGDVLLTSEAPLGEVAQVPDDDPLVLSQRLFGLRGAQGVLDSGYLRFFLQSHVGQARLNALQSGSTVAGIRQARLREVLIPLPEYRAQQRITGVLGAFDDLIETNRKLARGCEEALFASVAALAFDAPTVLFGSVAKRGNDRVLPSQMKESEPYLGLEHFATAGLGLEGRGNAAGITSQSQRFECGDVLYGKLRPYFQKVARPGFGGVCSGEIWVLRALDGYPQAALHAVVQNKRFSDMATAGSGGTRMPRADWKHMAEYPVPDVRGVLSRSEIQALEDLWGAACELRAEADELARHRDELLPLLMSGKVRVSEAEGSLP